MERSKRKQIEKILSVSSALEIAKKSYWKAYNAAHRYQKRSSAKRGE